MKSINDILKPEHQLILENEGKYSFEDVLGAKRKAKIEQEEASRLGITVDELRIKKQIERESLNKKIKEREESIGLLTNVSLKEFGDTCFNILIKDCKSTGSTFNLEDANTVELYREIIRYFYWDCDCEKLDKSRFIFLFGVYGCGKSMLVKSIYKALLFHRHDNWAYFHIPTLTKNYMLQSSDKDKKNDAFEMLFSCKKNMILDEIGDKSEKQKFYGNEIESIRALILEKYDRWISNNGTDGSQRIAFTSNLFPDKEYFFTQSDNDNRATLRNFYDDKIFNKMGQMCNLVRFPNISYRTTNRVELLY